MANDAPIPIRYVLSLFDESLYANAIRFTTSTPPGAIARGDFIDPQGFADRLSQPIDMKTTVFQVEWTRHQIVAHKDHVDHITEIRMRRVPIAATMT